MLDKTASTRVLKRLFNRFPVSDLDMLSRTLKTNSRMSIFRRLREIGYFSSYTHAGRYYTLVHIPQFDDYGLWIHQGIGFSRVGTLKATIVELVDRAPSGLAHIELNHLLRVKVQNTLLTLVRESRVHRARIDRAYLYVSAETGKAAEQISRRRGQLADKPKRITELSTTTVIEVLIETIHAGQVHIAPMLVAQRLSTRGVPVTAKQVEQVFARYSIVTEKKTSESSSTRSQA